MKINDCWIMFVNIHHFCSKTYLSHNFALKAHVFGHQVEHNWFLRKYRHFNLSLHDEIASCTYMVRCGETAKNDPPWSDLYICFSGGNRTYTKQEHMLMNHMLSSLQMKFEKIKLKSWLWIFFFSITGLLIRYANSNNLLLPRQYWFWHKILCTLGKTYILNKNN